MSNNGNGNASSSFVPALEVRDLRKSFGNVSVLEGISLSVREGEVISVIGAIMESSFTRSTSFSL